MLRSSALIALLLSARALVGADPSLPQYVPPNTRILIGVQFRAILDSDWGKAVLEQVKSASGDVWTKGLPVIGFDPLKDLDEVWIMGTSMDNKAPMLAVLRGRFDASRLPAAIGRYHEVPLVPMDAKRQQLLAFLNPSTLLAGDRFTVERAIDRHASATAPNAHLLAAAVALRARYWIWAVADGLDGVPASKTAPKGIEAVEGFEFGLALNPDLEMAAQLHMRSAEDAQKVMGTLAMFQMMAQNQKGASQAKLESHVTGKTVDVSLHVPEEELKQAWEQQRAAIAQSLSQLPQQIAAARSGTFNPFSPSKQASAPAAPNYSRRTPVSRESKIVSDDDGNTVQLTLPGRR